MKSWRSAWLVAVAVLAFGCSSSSAGTGGPITGLAGPTTTSSTVAPPPQTIPLGARPHDKGFTVVSIALSQSNIVGVFAGTAVVENDGQHNHTAEMKFTFMRGGKVLGHATTLARTVPVGKAVTVQLASTDPWDGGVVSYGFQVTNLF